MSDLISRREAIDALHKEIIRRRLSEDSNDDGALDEFDTEAILRQLPSMQSEHNPEFIKLTVRESNGKPYYSIIYLEVDDNGVGHDFEGYSSYSLDVISDYLKKYFMPSALRWIPCSERLPEYGVSVLTYDGNCFCVEKQIPIIRDENGEAISSNWWVSDDYDESCDDYYPNLRDGACIAWMPLPEPYRKVGESSEEG